MWGLRPRTAVSVSQAVICRTCSTIVAFESCPSSSLEYQPSSGRAVPHISHSFSAP